MASTACSTRSPVDARLRRRDLGALAGALAVLARQARAQDYPVRPVRWIVPWPPGGSTDAIARLLAQAMSPLLGQAVVIDNRAGAGGTIGGDATAKAAPDGYTALVSDGALATARGLYRSLPFDPLTDLVPVTGFVTLPHVVVVRADAPAASLAEFVAEAKARPGALDFGSGGIGSPLHLAGEVLRVAAGITWTHIPYRGAGPAVTALLTGEVQVLVPSLPAVIGHLLDGRLRALAVTSAARSPLLPAVPTVAEAGLPDAQMAGWVGLHLPAGAPAPTITRLHAAATAALADATLRQRLLEQGAQIMGSTPDAYGAFLRDEAARWQRVIQAAGIQPE